jgi:uncharacterized membrane protein
VVSKEKLNIKGNLEKLDVLAHEIYDRRKEMAKMLKELEEQELDAYEKEKLNYIESLYYGSVLNN